MNKRMFTLALRTITTGRGPNAHVDVSLIPTKLTRAQAAKMVSWIVRCRGPVLLALIQHGQTDRQWLASCGYLSQTTGRGGYVFVHTSEHHIKQ